MLKRADWQALQAAVPIAVASGQIQLEFSFVTGRKDCVHEPDYREHNEQESREDDAAV
jgi:hypothetical protein